MMICCRYVSPKEGGAPRRSADTQTVEIESGRPGTMKACFDAELAFGD